MTPAALLVLLALGVWLVQTSAHRNPRRYRNPRRLVPRRRVDRCYACGRRLEQGATRYLMPTGPTGPRIVLCPSCADELVERRQARGDSGPTLRRLNPRPNVWGQRRGATPTQCCGCGSGYPCRPNPYTPACRIGPGHVWDFRHGGRCECCGRAAPKRLVTLEWDSGARTNYGRTCAGRAIGTTKLRTNQLAHMDREAADLAAKEALYRGVRRESMAASGIVRPPYAWARSMSLEALKEIARDARVSPYRDGWWDSANLRPGGHEMRYRQGIGIQVRRKRSGEYDRAVLQGAHRGDARRSARTVTSSSTTRPARRSRYAARPGEDLPF